MGDLAWVKKRFPQNLVIEFFPGIQRCKIFFPALYALRDIFFIIGIFFAGISLQEFFPSKISLQDIFFSEITHTTIKSRMVVP